MCIAEQIAFPAPHTDESKPVKFPASEMTRITISRMNKNDLLQTNDTDGVHAE